MGGRPRILLVDDRSENLVALEAVLAPLEAEIVAVQSGKQALTALATGDFAVVLLDVMMPEMDGFETAERIKHGPHNQDVPIIFLTAASTRPDFTFRGYNTGAVDYLAKPFDPWVLTAKVQVFVDLYLKNTQRTEELSSRIAEVEEAATLLAKDPTAEESLARLLGRVGQLRDALRDRPR